MRRAPEEIGDALEKKPALLLGWHLERLRNIRKPAPQAREQTRDLGRRVAEYVPYLGRRQPLGALLHELDEWDERLGSLYLVAAPGERETSVTRPHVEDLFGQPGLTDTRLSPEQYHAAT